MGCGFAYRGTIPELVMSVKVFAPCLPMVISGSLRGQVKLRGFWAKSWQLTERKAYGEPSYNLFATHLANLPPLLLTSIVGSFTHYMRYRIFSLESPSGPLAGYPLRRQCWLDIIYASKCVMFE